MIDRLKHLAGFIVSGGIAFVVDVGVLHLLTAYAGMPPLAARVLAIAAAMVAGWLCHRRLTWNVPTPPTLAEFVRYAGMAWTAAAINYAVFAALLLIFPALSPSAAVAISSVLAMAASYVGMKYGVFRKDDSG